MLKIKVLKDFIRVYDGTEIIDEFEDVPYFQFHRFFTSKGKENFILDCYKNNDTDGFAKILNYVPSAEEMEKLNRKQVEYLPYGTLEEKRKTNYIVYQRIQKHKDVIYRENSEAKWQKELGNENWQDFEFDKSIFEQKHYIDWVFFRDLSKQRIDELKKQLIECGILEYIKIPETTRFCNVSEAFDYLQNINIGKIFNISSDKWVDCPFLSEHKCCVRKNKNNKMQFLIIQPETEKGYILNLANLLELYGIDIKEFIRQKQLAIGQIQNRDLAINRCMAVVDTLKSRKAKKLYPNLNRYLKKYIPVIEVAFGMFVENLKNVIPEENTDVLFFSYIENIVKSHGDTDKSTVSRLLNSLCVFELLTKVRNPSSLRYNRRDYSHQVLYEINYFKIYEIDWQLAEERAKILRENGISLNNLSSKNITDVFGSDFSDKVFQKMIEK